MDTGGVDMAKPDKLHGRRNPFVRSESVRIEAGSSVTVLDSVLLLPQPVTEHVAVTFKYAYAGKPLSEAKEAMVYRMWLKQRNG